MAMRIQDDGSIVSRVTRIPDVIKVRLNEDEKKILIMCMDKLNQPKHSTTLKQLALSIGANVVTDSFIGVILNEVLENKRKNERTGYDVEFS